MDDSKLRSLAIDVFRNSNTETILQALSSVPRSGLAVSELDAFNRYLSDTVSKEQEDLDSANKKYDDAEMLESPCRKGNSVADSLQKSNISQSLRKMSQIDVFKSPSKQLYTVIKKSEPFISATGRGSISEPAIQFGKNKPVNSELFADLFGSGKGLDAKVPKMNDRGQALFQNPMGVKSMPGSELEAQDNHSDDEAGW